MLLGIVTVPRVQDKIHQELDATVGPGRLPTLEDTPSLTYLQAVFMEALRWKPVLPLGIPRQAMFDDEYMGYSIPAGTVIVPNVWALLFDEERYPHAQEFNPDRFMRDGKLDLRDNDPTIAFGFGRRICPGRHLAKDTVILIMASILHVFNIEPAADNISQDMNTGFVS
ncbi:hypothetical protein EIP86_011426 [Pleurotus ostreatoroseus]|nr:hypothetical protein EIP86_011426 [Pleurotus ostreatoroseus]